MDDYLTHLEKYAAAADAAKLDNPVWHIHGGHPPKPESPIRFSLLLNLASACNAESAPVLWGFLKRELPDATPQNSPMLDKLCGFAVKYYHDFVKPAKRFRLATDNERAALAVLRDYLAALGPRCRRPRTSRPKFTTSASPHYGKETMRDWFKAMYELLLGSTQGPRMGSFIALFGAKETITLIDTALARREAA